MDQHNQRFAATFTAGVLLSTAALFLILGCGQLEQIDQAVWGTTDAPAEHPPGAAPPLLELIATGLAVLGFGGMSAWVKRSNTRGKTTAADLQEQINVLSTHVQLLEKDTPR